MNQLYNEKNNESSRSYSPNVVGLSLDSAIMIKYSEKSDHDIWEAFKKGDEAAFNFIYRKYTPDLFNFGYQLCHKVELVRDCIQNLFIDLRRRREHLSDVVSIKSYLFKGLYREVIRKSEKERKFIFSSQLVEEKGFDIEVSHETKLINDELTGEVKQKLQEAMDKLTVKQKKAILLFYEECFSYKEVAEVMQLKGAKSARKLVYRAIASIKKELEGNAGLISFIASCIAIFMLMKFYFIK